MSDKSGEGPGFDRFCLEKLDIQLFRVARLIN